MNRVVTAYPGEKERTRASWTERGVARVVKGGGL